MEISGGERCCWNQWKSSTQILFPQLIRLMALLTVHFTTTTVNSHLQVILQLKAQRNPLFSMFYIPELLLLLKTSANYCLNQISIFYFTRRKVINIFKKTRPKVRKTFHKCCVVLSGWNESEIFLYLSRIAVQGWCHAAGLWSELSPVCCPLKTGYGAFWSRYHRLSEGPQRLRH